MKLLSDLINSNLDLNIEGITDDSRLVKSNYIFVATKGYNVDHYDYIEDAIKRGCVFLVVDRKIEIDFPHIIVDNINSYYKELCIKYYDLDLDKFNFIGITGTDGKTTTTSIIKELIGDCAYIGTNGLTIGNKTVSINNTTPCVPELCECLRKIEDEKVNNVVMEVSSEALLHDRVDNFKFSIVAFTNVTGDHFNVHGTFENYLNSKLKLLDLVKKDGIVVINGDDDNLNKIKCNNLYSFGFGENNDFIIDDVKYLERKTIFSLKNKDKTYIIESPLIGKYNVYNVSEAFIIALLYGIDSSTLIEKIKNLKPITGRCEFLDFGQKYKIVLDYAHTINGISEILDAFSNYKNVITVTGCAGGRDKSKRATIGSMVIEKSSIAIFTMDDQRFESVDDIIDEMVLDKTNYIRETDREKAIFKALDLAAERVDSVVLIIGKGRDNYMAIGDKKVPYNDYDVIKKYFE